MGNNLEQLLNSLIEKGWKPFGINYYCSFNIREKRIEIIGGPFGGGEYMLEKIPSLRELVSKESGLWQFVCENELTIKIRSGSEWKHNAGDEEEFNKRDYQYRLIESALKDESELEEFLLNSIKLD